MKLQVKKYCLLIIITLLFINSSQSQTDTLFWFAVPYGARAHTVQEANLTITATDLDDPTHIMITQPYVPDPTDPTTYIDTINVTIDPTVLPLKLTWDTLLESATLLKVMNNTFVQNPIDPSPYLSNAALKIQSDRKIMAYYEYSRKLNNPDIYSLKGTNALGTDFWVPYQNTWNNHDFDMPAKPDVSMSQILVVATEPNTVIQVDFQKDAFGMPAAGSPYTFTFAKPGQTLMFVPKSDPTDNGDPSVKAADRLKGTHITSNEPIAVTVGDGSVQKLNAYDMVGDQLVPVENMFGDATIGLKYIVMKGEVWDRAAPDYNERVYVLTTENNTTVNYKKKGGVLTNLMTNASAGFQDYIDLYRNVAPNDEYVYIESDKPIYVWHVSGFGDEIGGAIVPTVDGCTGSLDVSFVRSKDWVGATYNDFYLNIMTHADALNSFEIDTSGVFEPFLTSADFEYSGYGDFYVLKDGSSKRNDFPAGKPTRIRNTKNVFHLGTINGVKSGGGCAYGYFSDYIQNDGSANIVASGSDIITACYGEEVELEASGGLSYLWMSTTGSDVYLDDVHIAEPSAYLPVGIHQFQVEIKGPCGLHDTLPVSAEINENTEAYFSLDEYIGCAPLTVELNNLTVHADTFLFDWEDNRNYDYFANSTTTFPIYHTYNNNTNSDSVYTLKLFAYDKQKDCPDIYTKKVRVFPEIDADFDADTLIGCNPLTVNFTDLSISPTSTYDTYKWDFGDGQSIIDTIPPVDVTHEFKHFDPTDTVDYYVELVATSPYFCRDTARATISVFSYLESEFTIDTAYGCSPFRVTFTNISAGEDSISLIFGDGDIYNNNTFNILPHTYSNTTDTVVSYPVELQAFNDEGCVEVWRDTIVVYPEFKADYTIDGNSYVGCNERNVVFTNTTSPMSADAASIFLWNFGDGTNSSATSPSHIYDNNFSGDHDYVFTLHAESQYGCSDDTANLITIYRAEARFAVNVDEGCSPLKVSVSNSSVGSDITNWDWDYGDGHTDVLKDPFAYTYRNKTGASKTNKLLLEVTGTNGCSSRDSVDITVYPEIRATYDTAMSIIASCDSLMVEFNSSVFDPGLAATALYTWDFGDGASSSDPDPTYAYRNLSSATPVPYTVSLHVETPLGCSYDTISQVIVNPMVNANILIDKKAGCSPLTVDVNAQSYIGNDSYSWDYGDATGTNFIRNPAPYIYPANQSYITAPAGDDNYELILEVEDGTGNCVDRDTVDITVYSEIVADYNPKNVTDCNPYTVNFTDNSSANAVTWKWDFKDGSTSSDQNPSNTFLNTNSTTKIFGVKLGVTSDRGCTDSTVNQVSVLPYVVADFDVDVSEGCSPLTVTIDNNSAGGTYRWYWNSSDGSGVADYTSNNSNEIFNHIYTNTSGSDQLVYLTLIAENVSGCTDTTTVPITVYSEAKADFDPQGSIDCNPYTVTFDNLSFNAATYQWNFNDGVTSNVFEPTHVFTNLTNSNKPYNVKLEVTSNRGCKHDTTATVSVYRYVNANFDISVTEGCSPLTVEISNNSAGGTYRWYWNSSDGSGAADYTSTNSTEDFNHIYTNTSGADQVVYLTLIAENIPGCTDTSSVPITVYSEAKADFDPQGSIDCNPYTVTFDNLSFNAATYQWDFNDGVTSNVFEPTHVFTNLTNSNKPFNVKLEVTSNRGCKHDTTATVSVYRYVNANFDISVTEGCSPLTVEISNNSAGGNYRWYWNSSDGSGAADYTSTNSTEDFNHTYTNSSGSTQINNLMVISDNGNGCYDTLIRTVTVHSTIDAEFTADTTEGCNPLTVQFTNNTVNGSVYNWSFGDGSTTTEISPTRTFTNNTTNDKPFTVRLTAESSEGCTDEEQMDITVYSKVVSDFAMDKSEGCPPFTTTIENNSVGNALNTYEWLIDNVSVTGSPTNMSDFNHTYDNTTTALRPYDVKLIATNPHGCTSEHTDIITAYEYVEASYSMDIDNGCSPLDVQFTDLSTVPVSTNYRWEFGDGSSSGLAEPTHKFYNSSRTSDLTRTVRLTVQSQNYCSDDTSMTVDIYHQPLAKFYIDKTSSCPPLQSTLTKMSEGEDSFEWRFGDGNTNTNDANLTYSWQNTDIDNIQTYNLEFWVSTSNNCKDSTSLDLSVFPRVIADYTITDSLGLPLTGGCSPLKKAQFTNESTSPAKQFFWSFGDGSSTNLENPSHDFANIGITDRTYNIFFKALSEYNCWDTITKQVKVYVQPDAEFYVDPVLLTYPDNVVALENKTNSGPFSYLWDFGDRNNSTSTVEEPTSFEYEHWGEKIIELTVTSQTNSNCTDNFSDTILIQPPKVNADFTTNIAGGCWDGGLEVDFMAENSAYAEEYTYEWDFGDGQTGEGQNITHVFDSVGTYNVQLTAKSTEGAGQDYAYKRINVYPNPEVNFEVSPKLVMLDPSTLKARVKFYNLSECNDTTSVGCSYLWDFGDGETAISSDVTHAYAPSPDDVPIKYDITLYAETSHGCRDTLTLYEEVEIIGAGQIAFPNAFTPDGRGPAENETFKPVSEGVIQYQLWIYNRWGELIFTTKDLNVGWDGNINGEMAKPDVYVWKAQGKFTNGRGFELAGDVTLIR